MKNRTILILLFVITLTAWSCNETPKKVNDTEKKEVKTGNEEKKKAESELLENLKNTTPVDVANLEVWIPKTLGGLILERTQSVAFQKDQVQMTGFYKRQGNKLINLSITDAAGSGGEMVASKINVFGTEPDAAVGDIQMRSVNVKGRMARQDRNDKKKMTNILFFHNMRFMIKITTFDYGIEETWNLVDKLDFAALDALIE